MPGSETGESLGFAKTASPRFRGGPFLKEQMKSDRGPHLISPSSFVHTNTEFLGLFRFSENSVEFLSCHMSKS